MHDIMEASIENGLTAYRDRDFNRCSQIFEACIRRNLRVAEAYYYLGLANLSGYADYEAAADCFKKAIQSDPSFVEARSNLAAMQYQLGDTKTAYTNYISLLEKLPNDKVVLNNTGKLARDYRDYRVAKRCLEHLVSLQPDFVDGLFNLSNVYTDLGMLNKALVLLEKIKLISPQHVKSRANLGRLYLMMGEWEKGWEDYFWRVPLLTSHQYYTDPVTQKDLPLPNQCQLDISKVRKVAVFADQGLGDEIFFLRFVPLLNSKGIFISYLPSAKLAPLLKCSSLPLVLEKQGATYWQLEPDLTLAVSDLGWLANKIGIQPSGAPLLFDRAVLQKIDSAKRNDSSSRPKIGITWRAGDPSKANSLSKEVALPQLLQSLKGLDVELVVLQRNPKIGEVQYIKANWENAVIDASKANDDLCEVASVLSSLDHYVGVSNTNVHIGAGLQLPTSVLLPAEGDFRWMLGERSTWFPDIPLYRESLSDGWKPALLALREELHQQFGRE